MGVEIDQEESQESKRRENIMERMRKIGLLVLISFLLALIICLPLFNKWLNVLLRVSEGERKNNEGITFSIQHEDNPINKELQNFAALYNALIENQKEGYMYYEIYFQYLENFSEQKEFYSVTSGELVNPCSAVNCIQVSENVIDDFHIKVSEGVSLSENDFIHKKDDEIPILMGNLYCSIYKLEDTFTFTYLYDDYTFKVVGFLEEGSRIDSSDYPIDLDKYIVMPCFTIEDNVEITNGLKIHYANKTSGIIEVPEGEKEIFYSTVRPLLENAGVGTYTWSIRPMEYAFEEKFGIDVETFQKIVWGIVFLAFLCEIWLIWRLSKIIWHGKRKLILRFFMYGLLISILASIFYVLIQVVYIVVLGIKVFSLVHFVVIGAIAFGAMFICRVLKNGK